MARYYPTEDTFINIARGLVKDTSGESKFGATPEISVSQTATIWDKSDTLYPWSSLATASILNVDSSSASDVGESVTIVGLDANFNPQTETSLYFTKLGWLNSPTLKKVPTLGLSRLMGEPTSIELRFIPWLLVLILIIIISNMLNLINIR